MIIIAAFLTVAGTGLCILAGLGYLAPHVDDASPLLFLGVLVAIMMFALFTDLAGKL